jgi:hypothetical protein
MTIMLEKRQRLLPEDALVRRRRRSNPSGKCPQKRRTRGTVTRAAHPSGRARRWFFGNEVLMHGRFRARRTQHVVY